MRVEHVPTQIPREPQLDLKPGDIFEFKSKVQHGFQYGLVLHNSRIGSEGADGFQVLLIGGKTGTPRLSLKGTKYYAECRMIERKFRSGEALHLLQET